MGVLDFSFFHMTFVERIMYMKMRYSTLFLLSLWSLLGGKNTLLCTPERKLSKIEEISQYYPVCFLEDIDYSTFIFTKSKINFNRHVYFDAARRQYYKIWDKEYVFCPYFLNAIKKNFYLDIAPLKCVIFDKQDFCRGYITTALNDYRKDENYLKAAGIKLMPLSCQNDAFRVFLEKLKKRVSDTGLIYYDLTRENVSFDGHDYFLVDLEPVLDMASCKKNVLQFNEALKYNQPYYCAFIKEILKR